MTGFIFAALLLLVGALAAFKIIKDSRKAEEFPATASRPAARIDRKELAYASAIIVVVAIVPLLSSTYRFKRLDDPNKEFAEQALQSARNAMLDPTAVKFKNVTVNRNANCMYGQILAKNALGAYTGYRDFVWINRRTYVSYPDQASPLATA